MCMIAMYGDLTIIIMTTTGLGIPPGQSEAHLRSMIRGNPGTLMRKIFTGEYYDLLSDLGNISVIIGYREHG